MTSQAIFQCQECGYPIFDDIEDLVFDEGCPDCGSCDIDLYSPEWGAPAVPPMTLGELPVNATFRFDDDPAATRYEHRGNGWHQIAGRTYTGGPWHAEADRRVWDVRVPKGGAQ